MVATNYPHAERPGDFKDWQTLNRWLRRLHDAFENVRRGKIDGVTSITLTAGAASTAFMHPLLAPESVVCFDPKTANAAADLYGGGMYVLTADRGAGTWTITHPNNANADRTFQTSILGG